MAQTLEIARRCTFSLEDLRYEYPTELTPPGMSQDAYLRQETYLGAARRFPTGVPDKVRAQIEYELALI